MKKASIIFLVLATAGVSIFATTIYQEDQKEEKQEKTDESKGKTTAKEESEKNHLVQSVSSPFVPEKILFAGKEIPQDNIDFHERLDKEIIVNMYRHSHTLLFLKKSKKYFPIIEPILKKNGIPDDFKYLAVIESGLSNVVSPANAAGIWQFMKATGKSYNLEINKYVDERYHLEKSTQAACEYLKNVNKVYDDWILAAAAYNRGQGGISNALEDQNVESYFDLYLNSETSRYVFRMLAVKLIMENPEKYGFFLEEGEYYHFPSTKTIEIDYAIDNLKEFAKEKGTNYKTIKLLNPWIRNVKLPKGKNSYQIKTL
jgi:hypothetical protein